MPTKLGGTGSLSPMAAAKDLVPKDGYDRLEYFLKLRLADLGMTQEELAARGGPDPSTLAKVRNRAGQNTPKAATLLNWDDQVGWERGSCAVTLLGDTPREVGAITTGGQITANEKLVRLLRQAGRANNKMSAALTTALAENERLTRQIQAALDTLK